LLNGIVVWFFCPGSNTSLFICQAFGKKFAKSSLLLF
jgi:hypothetical protein